MIALAAVLLAVPPPLMIGFGVADINPPAGYRMAGNYAEKLGTGVLPDDGLVAQAVYLEQGDAKFVLIVTDTCGQERGLTDAIRKQVRETYRVPEKNVVVAATHTHGGPMHYDPVLLSVFRDRLGAKSDADDPKELDKYREKFVSGCVRAVRSARSAAQPATFAAGTATVPGLAFNRRHHMKNGTVVTNPGKRNPGIVKSAGPVDDTLPMLFARNPMNQPLGLLAAFPMHAAVAGGDRFQSDYPGQLRYALQKVHGQHFRSLYAAGCAGDINHVNVGTKDPDPTTQQIGAKLAAAVGETIPKLVDVPPSLKVASGIVKAPLRDDRPAEYAKARDQLVGKLAESTPFLDQVEAYRILLVKHYREKHGPAVPLEVTAVRVGESAAIVTLPHEIFVEIGLDIQKRSPFATTLIVTIANEVDCYVPTRKAFAEGSYEVTNSPYQPGVGELLADEAVRLLKELAK